MTSAASGDRTQFCFQEIQLPGHVVRIGAGQLLSITVGQQQRGHQRVSVTDDGRHDAAVDDCIEAEKDRNGTARAHDGDGRADVLDQQDPQLLEFLDHLTRGKAPGSGGTAVVLHHVLPDDSCFALQRT